MEALPAGLIPDDVAGPGPPRPASHSVWPTQLLIDRGSNRCVSTKPGHLTQSLHKRDGDACDRGGQPDSTQ